MRLAGWLILLIVAAVSLYLTCPNPRRSRMARWRGEPFAHRGLHDVDAGVVENTLPAFEAACRAGVGMELDVQLTRDGRLVVFHDDTLKRLAGDPRRVDQCTLEELRAIRLMGLDGARIPTFDEVLQTVDGRAPLLVELKSGRSNARLCADVRARLRDYPGEYLVESFNPLIVGWFRLRAPEIVRGQLVSPMRDYRPQANGVSGFFMAGLMLNFLTRPDFVAYDANARRFFSPHFQRVLFRTPMAAWTVHTGALAALVARRGEICIFEHIPVPAKKAAP